MSTPPFGLKGTPEIWADVDFGPTIGKHKRPINRERLVTHDGVVSVHPYDYLIMLAKLIPEPVTVQLPDLNLWMSRPYGGFQLIIHDKARNAATFPVTIVPFDGQTVGGATSLTMETDGGTIVLDPLANATDWVPLSSGTGGDTINQFTPFAFNTRAELAAATDINVTVVQVVFVAGYATAGDGGHGYYKYVATSTWADGEVVDVQGQVWQLVLENKTLRAQQLGVVADSSQDGTAGTDNAAAIRRCIAAPADVVHWPAGGIRFLSTIRFPSGRQRWIGQGGELGPNPNPWESTEAIAPPVDQDPVPEAPNPPNLSWASEWFTNGTAFVYAGSGNKYAFESDPPIPDGGTGRAFQLSFMENFALMTGYPYTPQANGTDCWYLWNIYHGVNTNWNGMGWRHRGGRRDLSHRPWIANPNYEAPGTPEEPKYLRGPPVPLIANWVPGLSENTSFGCLRIQDLLAGQSWVHNFSHCEWLTSCDRLGPNSGNPYLWEGYAWACDLWGNDNFMDHCHLNNCSLIGRNGGHFTISNTNFENGDWGSGVGFANPATNRVAIVCRAETGEKKAAGAGCKVTNTQFAQYTYAIGIDVSLRPGPMQCSLNVTNSSFRRNRDGEVLLLQNQEVGGSGGIIGDCSCTHYDEDELEEDEPDPVDNAGLGKAAPLRIKAIFGPNVVAPLTPLEETKWPGLRIDNNNVFFPETWDMNSCLTAGWWPRYNQSVWPAAGTVAAPVALTSTHIDARGVYPSYVGTPSSTPLTPATQGDIYPPLIMTSAAALDSSAEIFGAQAIAVRGAVPSVTAGAVTGGFFMRLRWNMAQVRPNHRGFFGLYNSAAPIPAGVGMQPSTFEQVCGVGFDSGEANFQFLLNGAGSAGIKLDLGSTFLTSNQNAVWELIIMTTAGGRKWYFRMVRLDRPSITAAQEFPNTAGPGEDRILYPKLWHNTSDNNNWVSLRLYAMECRTQPMLHTGSVFSGSQVWAPRP